jgi:ketosteroid isomerase-like protein
MNVPKPTILLTVLLALSVLACSTTRDAREDEAAVLQVTHDACRAYREADTRRMRELLTEDFTLTDPDGVITTLADDIEIAEKGTIRYEVFENYDMTVRLYGESAVVTGKTRVKGVAGTKSFARVFQFTDTLVRRDGRWWFAASHVSPLPAA